MLAQGTAFATTSCKGKGEKASGRTKYMSNSDLKAMSPEAQTKVMNAHKKAAEDDAMMNLLPTQSQLKQ
jgi:hypothetical protein